MLAHEITNQHPYVILPRHAAYTEIEAHFACSMGTNTKPAVSVKLDPLHNFLARLWQNLLSYDYILQSVLLLKVSDKSQ